jgi:hypothetical protein
MEPTDLTFFLKKRGRNVSFVYWHCSTKWLEHKLIYIYTCDDASEIRVDLNYELKALDFTVK